MRPKPALAEPRSRDTGPRHLAQMARARQRCRLGWGCRRPGGVSPWLAACRSGACSSHPTRPEMGYDSQRCLGADRDPVFARTRSGNERPSDAQRSGGILSQSPRSTSRRSRTPRPQCRTQPCGRSELRTSRVKARPTATLDGPPATPQWMAAGPSPRAVCRAGDRI